MTPDVTGQLASFAVRTHALDPAGDAYRVGRRTIATAVGLGVGNSHTETVERALAVVRSLGTAASCSLLGRSERVSATWAAFINGIAIHLDDSGNVDPATLVPHGAPVVAAALAVGEFAGATGRGVLEAVIVGLEVTIRVSLCLGPGHFERGWEPTGTAGHFGAAAAAGRLLKLDPSQMASALGIAATQAAGLRVASGTMTGPFHRGKAAANGVEACLLARRGFTGPATGIEGRRGFAQAASPNPDYSAALAGLCERWYVEHSTAKTYASGTTAHPADGHICSREVVSDGAGPSRPPTDAEIVRKAANAARPVLGQRAAECIELALAIDGLSLVQELLQAVRPR